MAATTLTGPEILDAPEVAHLSASRPVAARTTPVPADVAPAVSRALAAAGITSLYEHQAEAWAASARREHVIVATGTASGKSLCFALPVLDALARDPRRRALYLSPTKALAQDQARSLAALRVPRVRAAIYDGDTEPERRWQVRRGANVVFSNPDMLHVGILPHHDRWDQLFANLDTVVVDEAHVYRGVFGSHVANVLRRLRRVAELHGSTPRFVLASATIGNPGELARSLLGVEATVIHRDGAAHHGRVEVIWNPELLDPQLGLRASTLGDAARLLSELVTQGLRTICFTKSRKAAELVHRFACERVEPDVANRLSPYRAGYTAAQRRSIEQRLVAGELLGVTATDALELGIDVGALDCAISVGFPGTVSSLRQQWGRAGRRRSGIGIMVCTEDALDQFFARAPEALLRRPVEAALLDHANARVLAGHVRAASFEAPLTGGDTATLGEAALQLAAALGERGELRRTPAGLAWAGRDQPAARTSLRSSAGAAVAIVESETGAVLGSVDGPRVASTVHEGAIYLHLGEAYRVVANEGRTALVEPFAGDYYTQTVRETSTDIRATRDRSTALGVELRFGEVSVTEQVIAYQRRRVGDGSAIETLPLVSAPQTFETESVWFVPSEHHLDHVAGIRELLGTLHAAEHALISLLPLWAMCDRWDIGGLSTNLHPQTCSPTVFVYDGHAGGVGIAERGYACFAGWVADTERLLAGCGCERGCPSCVQSPKCGNLNEPLDKRGALRLLRSMLAVGAG